MTNSKNCLLAGKCKEKDNENLCKSSCSSFVAMHGASGSGGRCYNANIPKDYALITNENSPTRQNQPEVYKALDAYVNTFSRQFDESEDRIKSVYLWSQSPGTGKTTSAVGLANSYLIAHYIGSLKYSKQILQRPVLFVDVNQLQTDYNQFNRPRVPEDVAEPAAQRYYRTIELAKVTPFVVLDDVGIRESTDGFRSDLHSIINARVTNKLATVYTSNLPVKELPLVFGEQRLADRIRDMTAEIEFNGGSHRGMRK